MHAWQPSTWVVWLPVHVDACMVGACRAAVLCAERGEERGWPIHLLPSSLPSFPPSLSVTYLHDMTWRGMPVMWLAGT